MVVSRIETNVVEPVQFENWWPELIFKNHVGPSDQYQCRALDFKRYNCFYIDLNKVPSMSSTFIVLFYTAFSTGLHQRGGEQDRRNNDSSGAMAAQWLELRTLD